MIGCILTMCIGAVRGNWPMWGGEPSRQSVQLLKGAITSPVIKWRFATGSSVERQFSAIADVDGDGQMEVVIGSDDYKVYCLRGSDGTQKWAFTTGYWVESSAAIADCDGDGRMEVVIGSCDDKVYCLRGSDGTLKWAFTTSGDVSSPAIADVDGDGKTEVVVGCSNYYVYCLRGSDGAQKWTFMTSTAVSSPAIADCDGDGKMEVVIGSYDHNVYCLAGSDGIQKWVFTTGGTVRSSPAVADCDGDGHAEVVIGSDDRKVYCLAGSDGTQKWVFTTSVNVHLPGALVDIDGDNRLEYLVSQLSDSVLYCLNAEDGTLAWQITLAYTVNSPFAGDIDGDGCSEIIVGTRGTYGQGYRVFAIDDQNNSQGCGPVYEDIEEGLSKGFEFRAVGRGIYLFMPNEAQVSLTLYDAQGRLVQRLYDGVLTSGGHTFNPDLETKGVYMAVLRYQGGMKSLKIVR